MQQVDVYEYEGSFTLTVDRAGSPGQLASCSDGLLEYVVKQNNGANPPAEGGIDFRATGGALNFGPGQTSATIAVTVFDDDEDENDVEFFLVTLSHHDDDALGSNKEVTVRLLDDQGAFRFRDARYDPPDTATNVTVFIERIHETHTAANVNLRYVQDGDGVANRTGTFNVSFSPGVTSRNVSIPLGQSDAYAGTVSLELYGPTPSPQTWLASPSESLIVIEEPPPPGPVDAVVQFSQDVYRVREDGAGVTVGVVRSGSTTSVATIAYAAQPGTATTDDFLPTVGTFTFAAGETQKTFTVTVFDDDDDEPAETIWLVLRDAGNGTAYGTRYAATILIEDDEGASAGNEDTPAVGWVGFVAALACAAAWARRRS